MIKKLQKKISLLVIFLIAISFILMLPLGSIANADTWTQVNDNGFGDVANTTATGIFKYKGYLYSKVDNAIGAQIWRSSTGEYGSWTKVVDFAVGLGVDLDTANTALRAKKEFYDGGLYVPTLNNNGTEIWQTFDGVNWRQVNINGFGDINNKEARSLGILRGFMYFGTKNATGGQVWRTSNPNDPLSWVKIADFATGLGVDIDPKNTQVQAGVEKDGYIYFSTVNTQGPNPDGTEVWRTDGITWERINDNGFGDVNNRASVLSFFEGRLYAGTNNSFSGGRLFAYSGGTVWNPIATAIESDTNNWMIKLRHEVMTDNMYAATINRSTGAEIWKTNDGVNWTQSNIDGFDNDVFNVEGWVGETSDGYLYASTSNSNNGAEVWRMAMAKKNLLRNRSFDKDYNVDGIPENWTPTNFAPGDGRSEDFNIEGRFSLIISSEAKLKYIKQKVDVSGLVGDSYTLSGRNKNIGTTYNGKCIRAFIYLRDASGRLIASASIPFSRSTHDWIKGSVNIVAPTDYAYIEVLIANANQTGVAYFDDFKLVKNN